MSKRQTPIVQTYYEFSDVKHREVNTSLDYTDNVFMYLQSMRYAKGMQAISLKVLEQLINNYSNADGGKEEDRCLLKGLYKDNYNGVDCYKNVPYLFYDIDVKDDIKNGKIRKENIHLFDPEANQKVFETLKKVSVFCWRSNSKVGITGVIYVPQLENYLSNESALHLQAGKQITSYLSEYLHSVTGIDRIKFDDKQSVFRQLRYLAEQNQERKLNITPLEFTYKVEEKIKERTAGVIEYRPHDYSKPKGTLISQFDNDNEVLNIALDNGFSTVGSNNGNTIRIHHPKTTSATSGAIDKSINIFYNHSGSFSNRKSFTPSQLLCKLRFNYNWSDFYKHLTALGYKEKQTPQEEIKDVSKALQCELLKTTNEVDEGKIIFKHCYDLQTLTNEQKQNFIKANCPRPELKKFFVHYLNLIDYGIKYDKEFNIKKYVDKQLGNVLNYLDKHNKVILGAETGKGKTTAFIRDFHKHRPGKRLLILVPLIIIVEQNKKEYYGKAIFLDGKSKPSEHKQAEYSNFVFATYKQGAKLLNVSKFDYIVVDEVHQLLTANSYKLKTIAELTPHLSENKVIGLTGTPSNIFKSIGYKLIKVGVTNPIKTEIEIRLSNKKGYDIALNHLNTVKGKTLLRLNDTIGLELLKKQLIDLKVFKANEIIILHSSKKVKSSKEFKQLAHERIFNDKVKLVLTTSLIDEGLSIDQTGFTDIVFIETDYNPRPEAQKQFFARFRNEDPNRNNYLYLREKNNQTPSRYNPEYAYSDKLRGLNNEIDESNGTDFKTTYNSAFSNNDFYYDDNTINPYYLAFSVTDVLFKSFNIEQFIEYSENNYNLSFTVNEAFKLFAGGGSNETKERKELKKLIAGEWYNNKIEVLHALGSHSLNKSIRNDLRDTQGFIDPNTEQIVINYIKDFEKLYKRTKKLEQLGVKEPDRILIDTSKALTLASEKNYKDEVTMLQVKNIIQNPQNEADKKAKVRLEQFAEWCKNQTEFTHVNMIKKLKSLSVYKNDSYTFDKMKRVLKYFDIELVRCTKTKILSVVKKLVS